MNAINLQNMVSEDAVRDNTDTIRELKHSQLIKAEVDRMFKIKIDNLDKSANDLNTLCALECPILFTYYTDIYNRIRKDEIDMGMLYTMIATMQKIENGEITTSEGAQQMADVIKQLYQMSAIKKGEKLDAAAAASAADTASASASAVANATDVDVSMNEIRLEETLKANLSWKSYKQTTAYVPTNNLSEFFDTEQKAQHFLMTSNIGKGKKKPHNNKKESKKQRTLHQLRAQKQLEHDMDIAYEQYKNNKTNN